MMDSLQTSGMDAATDVDRFAVIAIDGPAASGKSTVARRVAVELGRLYVDSGALYRAVTWQAVELGIDPGDCAAVVQLCSRIEPEFFVDGGAVRFRIEGAVPDRELRTVTINANVSLVAAVPAVREKIVAWLRGMVSLGNLVMEGRDIGTAVFPGARWKFYLDASPEERARRRHAESPAGSGEKSVEAVSDSLRRRDKIDSRRAVDPLRVDGMAVVIDSTGMTIDEVTQLVVDHVSGDG